ncbi:MAG: LemA family protein [Phycisphaerales bacterium]|nr:LemA family protein [Phycisphaerales bacterium]
MIVLANGILIGGSVAAAIALLLLIWVVANYNRFVSVRQHLKESWADVDVELKRRYNLIPNLVNTVKGYAAHEKAVFEEVTAARTQAMGNEGRPDRQSADEQRLARGVNRLMAVAEQYPDLKASENFVALQEELTDTEDRIAASRRFYNGNVREMNQLCRTFPSSILASIFGFEEQGFFEIDDASEREVPDATIN